MDLSTGINPKGWPVPARWVATAALLDKHWQVQTRRLLRGQGERLRVMLTRHGLAPDGGTALFQWLRTPGAAELHRALARRGILTRLIDEPASLCFSLPGDEAGWARFDAALSDLLSKRATS